MDKALELHLKDLEETKFHDLLTKLAITVKPTDLTTMAKADRYALYQAELETKFKETDIAITTLDELETLEAATSIDDFKTQMATLKSSANVSVTGTEAVEHTADLATIKANIADMTTKAAALKSEIEAYKTAKATMTATEITAKDLDIKTKKAEIETLRKTTQALIDTIRKALKDITDEDMKTAKEATEASLKEYETQLKAIETPGRNVIEKTWGRVKDNKKLLVGGIVVVGATLLVGWMAGWFKKKKKTGETTTTETTEKKPFRKKAWNVLKWTGIGAGAYYVVHGIGTGRWNIKDFFNRTSDFIPYDAKSLKEWYEKEIPEAQRTKYNKFGDMVDTFETKLNPSHTAFGKMIDNEGKDIDVPTGAVPAILDKVYDDVGEMISNPTTRYIYDQRRDVGQKLGDFVTKIGKKAAAAVFVPMIGTLKGLTAKMFGTDGAPNDAFTAWAEEESPDRDLQMGRMMQKYYDVRFFLSEKKDLLKRKYAKEELVAGGTTPSEEDIDDFLADDVKSKTVTLRIESDFLDKKIVGTIDTESALKTLEDESVFDAKSTDEVQGLADEAIAVRKTIIPDETLFTRAKESVDINKDAKLVAELKEVSTKFGERMDEGILKTNFMEQFCYFTGLDFDEIWNSSANDMEVVMEEMGFTEQLKEFEKENASFKTKLIKGTVTKADIEEFEDTLNEYLTLEFDATAGAEKRNQADAELPWYDRVFYRGAGRATAVGTWIMTPQGLGISIALLGANKLSGGLLFKGVGNAIKWPIKTGVSLGLKTLSFSSETILRRINMSGNYRILNRVKYKTYGAKDFTKFVTDAKAGKIEMRQIEYVFNRRFSEWNYSKGLNGFVGDTFNITAPKDVQIFRDYFNGNITKLAKNSTFKASELVKNLKAYETKQALLTGDRLKFFDKVFQTAKFKEVSDIQKLVTVIDDIKIDGLTGDALDEVAKGVGKKIGTLSTATEINTYIDTLKATVNKPIGGALDIFSKVDAEGAKIKIAENLKSSRTVKGYPGEFETGGTLDKPELKQFKQDYIDVLNKKSGRTYTTYDDVDKALTKRLFADQDAFAKTILEEANTKGITEFTTKMTESIGDLEKLAKTPLYAGTETSKVAMRSKITTQIKNLEDLKAMATTMTAEQLKGFETLYKNIKAVDGCMDALKTTWEAALKDEKLMTALTKGKGLEAFKSTVPEVKKVIELLKTSTAKDIEKVLAGGSKFEEALEVLMKGLGKVLKVIK